MTLTDLHVPMRSLRVLSRRTDGRQLLVGAGDAGKVRAWDLSTGLETALALRGGPKEGAQWVLAALCGPDGRELLAAAGVDRTLRLWDVLTGRPVNTVYSLLGDAVRAMAPFAGKLAIGDLQGRLWLFDPAEGRDWVRLSFAVTPDDLRRAVERIVAWQDGLRPTSRED